MTEGARALNNCRIANREWRRCWLIWHWLQWLARVFKNATVILEEIFFVYLASIVMNINSIDTSNLKYVIKAIQIVFGDEENCGEWGNITMLNGKIVEYWRHEIKNVGDKLELIYLVHRSYWFINLSCFSEDFIYSLFFRHIIFSYSVI